jgi:hypothetical protein
VCRPAECLGILIPPLCGSPDAPCGEECCQPDCGAKKCGTEDRCGESCGTCDPNYQCSIDGQCNLEPIVLLCPGDLRARGPVIAIEQPAGPMPTPEGGTIADGIYDLTAIHQYGRSTFAELYRQAAIEFAGGATTAEQIGVVDIAFFADPESPHRLMSVTADGTTLHFSVTCPGSPHVIEPNFDRGFTVHDSEVWLFQEGVVEVYARRP